MPSTPENRRGRRRGTPPSSLPAAALRYRTDPNRFPFRSTAEVDPLVGIIGQERALEGLQVGLELGAPGFNLFVCGLVGNGRATAVEAHLRKIRPYCPLSEDRAYVFSFGDPRRADLLTFPRGRASAFAREMDRLILTLIRELPQLFHSEAVQAHVSRLRRALEEPKLAECAEFEARLEAEGFALLRSEGEGGLQFEVRVRLAPQEAPVAEDDLPDLVRSGAITEERLRALLDALEQHKLDLHRMLRGWRLRDVEFVSKLAAARRALSAPFVDALLEPIRAAFPGDGVGRYLDGVRSDLFEHLPLFAEFAEAEHHPPERITHEVAARFYRYRVNVLLDHHGREGCPVVLESQPTFTRLFGGVDRPADRESDWSADFYYLRGGALLEADGGYLILDAADVLRESGVWPRLKASLRYGKLEIPEVDAENRRTMVLKPAGIPIRVKVLLLGSFELYQGLVTQDPEFQHIFKVRVDFDSEMERSDPLVCEQIPALIRKIGDAEGLLSLDRGAVAAVIDRAVRASGRRDRVSAIFTQLADLVREADFWARARGAAIVESADVARALEARAERVGLPEERSRRALRDGQVLLSVDGEAVGQVNGLVVISIGQDAFGAPVRITARAGMGEEGVISIEREVGMSGETHDKGVQILTGYLRGQYAQEHPLSLAASICFEQCYSGVEGDSASTAEVYAILSAISGLPIRQDLAVTGSMNQMGEVQAVGGINEKIEGFFRVVAERGFRGAPGVIVPQAALPALNLPDEILAAVDAGRFRIHPVTGIDQGLELLTGRRAGRRLESGAFERNSVHDIVARRLRRMAIGLARFRRG